MLNKERLKRLYAMGNAALNIYIGICSLGGASKKGINCSMYDLYRKLRSKGCKVSKSSVYALISQMCEMNILTMSDIGNNRKNICVNKTSLSSQKETPFTISLGGESFPLEGNVSSDELSSQGEIPFTISQGENGDLGDCLVSLQREIPFKRSPSLEGRGHRKGDAPPSDDENPTGDFSSPNPPSEPVETTEAKDAYIKMKKRKGPA
jgi:hypothetical protein